MRTLSAMLCSGMLLFGLASAQASTIYKWVDSQGQLHFGSQPPAGQDSERLTTRSWAPAPPAETETQTDTAVPESKSQQEIDREVKRQVAREQEELREYCLNMRTRLAQLKNNPRLMAEIDGQNVRLSEEERQQRILEAEQQIGEFCTD